MIGVESSKIETRECEGRSLHMIGGKPLTNACLFSQVLFSASLLISELDLGTRLTTQHVDGELMDPTWNDLDPEQVHVGWRSRNQILENSWIEGMSIKEAT